LQATSQQTKALSEEDWNGVCHLCVAIKPPAKAVHVHVALVIRVGCLKTSFAAQAVGVLAP